MAGGKSVKSFYPMFPKTYWLSIYLVNMAGRVPIHTVRYAVYRHLFGVKLGKDSVIQCGCRFFKPDCVSVGDGSYVYENAFLDGRKGLRIGDNVLIGSDVRIYTMDHVITCPVLGMKGGPVTINDRAYVGHRVTIMPGVTIGEGAIVMAGSTVTKDVMPWTVVGGVPAQHIEDRKVGKYTLETEFKAYFQ